ncbi:acylphosphatase [Candidatus Babeliales bacterium]|nr:acylphosphatase [Candidatus Babeliales bacterium]
MKQCLKIIVTGKVQEVGYRDFVKKNAEDNFIEGTVQNLEDSSILIYACGLSDNLDNLIDCLYKGTSKSKVQDLSIEPFVNEKDFRGVFRIIGD